MQGYINIPVHPHFICEITAPQNQEEFAKSFPSPNICWDCDAPLKANEHKIDAKTSKPATSN